MGDAPAITPQDSTHPDSLQAIRDSLQRRQAEATNQADRDERRRQLMKSLTGRFKELVKAACPVLALDNRQPSRINFADLARHLLVFNEELQRADREYPRHRILERLGRAARAGVPALDTATSLLLANPSTGVEQLASDLESISAAPAPDRWPMWLTYILDQLLNSHRPPAQNNVPPDTTRDQWRKAELAFGCILFSDQSFRVAQESVDRASALIDDAMRVGGYRVQNRPSGRVRDLIGLLDARAIHWYGSEPLHLMLRPPPAIEAITEPSALRRQLDEIWSAANCLQIALKKWATWFVELGEKQDAPPGVALNCDEIARRSIKVLLTYRPNVALFNTGDEADLLAMLPPVPAWWAPEAATAADQADGAERPKVRWQEDREWLDRYYWPPEQRHEKAHQLQGSAFRLIELLQSYPMAAVQPLAAGRNCGLQGQGNAAGVVKPDAPAQAVVQAEATRAATPSNALLALMRVFTNGIVDDRIDKATRLLADNKLTASEKLTKINTLIPFPATASAEQLGEMLGVTKQAVLKTDWWTENRKGEKDNEVGRRREGHRRRAKGYEKPGPEDDE